jgi:hypothetical protein
MIPMEIIWRAAGFLEGDGSFSVHHRGRGGPYNGVTVTASQVEIEPLLELQRVFGGRISPQNARNVRQAPAYNWVLYNSAAVGVMMTVYAMMMSTKRKRQIRKTIEEWKLHARVKSLKD